jgi:hypothetical protein
MAVLDNWHEPHSQKYNATKIALDTPILVQVGDKTYYSVKMRRFDDKERVADVRLSRTEAEEMLNALRLLLMRAT